MYIIILSSLENPQAGSKLLVDDLQVEQLEMLVGLEEVRDA